MPNIKKTTQKKAVRKPAVKKTAVTKTVAKKPARKKTVTNKKIRGMIEDNLSFASKARKQVFVDSEVMPSDYGSTSITLLARDPHWVHAYWEVALSSVEDLRQRIGDVVDQCARVLRVYDVSLIEFNGQNAHHWFDIDVGHDASNWYINLWSDHITCCADIGLREPNGFFHTLARSNCVTTPREHFSPRNEIIWMDIQPGEEDATSYVYMGHKPEPARRRADGSEPRRFRVYLTEDDIRAYYSRLFPLLSRVLAGRRKKGKGFPSGAEGDLMLESLEEMDLLGYDYFKRILLGGSEETWLRGRQLKEILGGGASEMLVSSWGASEKKPVKQDFFFELGTELVVYGRTEPDAVVFWGDRMIPLREDGSFTLRMALPTDTHIPLDFKTISYSKNEQRSITTSATRDKTDYNS